MLLQPSSFAPICPQRTGLPGRCCMYRRIMGRYGPCSNAVYTLLSADLCQDRKKAGSRLPLLAGSRFAVAACAQHSSVHTLSRELHVDQAKDKDVAPSRTRHHIRKRRRKQGKAAGSTVAKPPAPFDVMLDMAKNPSLLELFSPYLPKKSRTHAGLARAMRIQKWRNKVLVGESQVWESEIMTQVWRHAPDKDKLNEELRQLGFLGFMQR